MTPEEIAQFWEAFYYRYQNGNGGQRKGQAMFNALAAVAPILADDIRGTIYDPFHKDTSQDIMRFRDYVGV